MEFYRGIVDIIHRNIIHPILISGAALNDREIAHERALDLMEKVQGNPILMWALQKAFVYEDPILRTYLWVRKGAIGHGFPAANPLGLAAGFDKDARVYNYLGKAAGFGIVTTGSITKIPYSGNERPRIFDLPENDGLINRMGFPGKGIDEAKQRLSADNSLSFNSKFMHIINIAASKPSFEAGTVIEDYGEAFSEMIHFGLGTEINVSSPNTPGVRGLQDPVAFEDLTSLLETKRNQLPSWMIQKPLGYKFGPDLSEETLEKDIRIAIDNGANFVTLTNTSTDQTLRDSLKPDLYKNEVGGMSGALLETKALETSHRAYEFAGSEIQIIRAGGIGRSAMDIWDGLTYGGVTIVETYTAFVRRPTSTPNFTYYLLRDLAKAMRADGMTSMEDFKVLRGKKVPFPKI